MQNCSNLFKRCLKCKQLSKTKILFFFFLTLFFCCGQLPLANFTMSSVMPACKQRTSAIRIIAISFADSVMKCADYLMKSDVITVINLS